MDMVQLVVKRFSEKRLRFDAAGRWEARMI